MTTHYALLSVTPDAPADEIKRAFRREVARYHPDKVQHLGPEFQEIATVRSAALTEAYRTLMDDGLRRAYDEALAQGGATQDGSAPGGPASGSHASRPAAAAGPAPSAPPRAEPAQVRANDSTTHDLVKRAVLSKLNEAAGSLGGTPSPTAGFDVGFRIKGRQGLFRRAEPTVHVAARVIGQVDAAAVEAAWPAAVKIPAKGETACVMLLGSSLSSSRELAGAVSELRRKSRGSGPMVIPVDIRDWQALMPPETPPVVRSLLDRMRQGE